MDAVPSERFIHRWPFAGCALRDGRRGGRSGPACFRDAFSGGAGLHRLRSFARIAQTGGFTSLGEDRRQIELDLVVLVKVLDLRRSLVWKLPGDLLPVAAMLPKALDEPRLLLFRPLHLPTSPRPGRQTRRGGFLAQHAPRC
eukprot:scaffold726_cov262-Pinguiococcus_pyrenoidosus.AAC.18